jgi:hypothetical protein
MLRTSPFPWLSLLAASAAEALRQAWQDAGRAWQRLTLDADERYLRDACDLVDLEQRLKRLDTGRAEPLRWF